MTNEVVGMNLTNATEENLQYILKQLGQYLGVANDIMLDAKDYDLKKYEDIKFLYEHVVQSGRLSPQEAHAFIDELRAVRK